MPVKATKRFVKSAGGLLLLTLICLVSTPAEAEDGWDKSISFYLWSMSLEGTQTVRGRDVEVDVSFSELFKDIDIALTTHFEAKKEPWLVLFDLNFGKLGPETPALVDDLEVSFAFVELAGGYQLTEPLWLLFGARYVTLDVEVDFAPLPVPLPLPLPQTVEGDQDWVDPYVGLRVDRDLSEKWSIILRSDIGGFGVGSDFAWNVALLFERDLSRRWSIFFGGGVLDIDYEDGAGDTRFAYDVRHQGAILAINYNF